MADREAFDADVLERWVPLLRTATLLTGDRHAAQDLVQETLVRAAQRWSRVEPATADAYVRRILYTRSVGAVRVPSCSVGAVRVPSCSVSTVKSQTRHALERLRVLAP